MTQTPFCPQCGRQFAPGSNFCSVCGAAAASYTAQPRIVRPRAPRMIAGVCSGFAIHYGWDVSLVRILLCVFTIFTSGIGILCYLAAWIILPEAPYALPPASGYYPPAGTSSTEAPPHGTTPGTGI